MMRKIIFIFCIVLSCCKAANNNENKGLDKQSKSAYITEKKSLDKQSQSADIKELDYHDYSPDGRALYSDLDEIDWGAKVTDDYNAKLLSFLSKNNPKRIDYILNGNALVGTITEINIYSKNGDSFYKRDYEHIWDRGINYLEIEYEINNTDRKTLNFRIYDFIPFMSKNNFLIFRMSTGLLNDIEKPHDYFDGFYLGTIDIYLAQNNVKVVVEYVPNSHGVLF